MTTRIDDRDSAVTYSKPASGHHWNPNGSSTSYKGTATFTQTRNAWAEVTFSGSSITVYGVVPPKGTGKDAVSSYSIDGGSAVVYNASPQSVTQNQTVFFQSGTLSNGQHTLRITNLVEGDFLWIDYFAVEPNVAAVVVNKPPAVVTTVDRVTVTQSAPAINTPDPTPNKPTPTSVPTTRITTRVITDGSTTRTQLSTDVQTVVVVTQISTANQILGGDVTPTGSTDGGALVTGAPVIATGENGSKGAPIGAIVGGVVGGLAVIALLIIAWLLFRRKRSRDSAPVPLGSPDMAQAGPSPTSISPFDYPHYVAPQSTNPPSSAASNDNYQSGAFSQHPSGWGHAGAVSSGFTSEGSAAVGKRQLASSAAYSGPFATSTTASASGRGHAPGSSFSGTVSSPGGAMGHGTTVTGTGSDVYSELHDTNIATHGMDDAPPEYRPASTQMAAQVAAVGKN